jgi:signal peptidase II
MRSPTLPSASSAPQNSKVGNPYVTPTTHTPPLDGVPASRYALFFGLASLGAIVDLGTKHWVFSWARGTVAADGTQYGILTWFNNPAPERAGAWWLWNGYVGVQTALNEGALFGLGQGYTSIFALLSILAGLGICYWLFVMKAARDLLLTFALGCIAAGIIGNLYDRLGLWSDPANRVYAVRDWILLSYGQYTWPNFNIADCFLVCGAGVLLYHGFTQKDPDPEADNDSADSRTKTS